MTILSVSKANKDAVIRLDSDELVALCNSLYGATKGDNVKAIIYKMYADFIMARDLSQYGHIDAFSLDNIVNCRERAKFVE